MRNIKCSALCMVFLMMTGCQSTPQSPEGGQDSTSVSTEQNDLLATIERIREVHTEWRAKIKASHPMSIYSKNMVNDLLDQWEDVQHIYRQIEKEPGGVNEDYSLFSSRSYAQTFDQAVADLAEKHLALLALQQRADKLLAPSIKAMKYLASIGADKESSREFKVLARQYRRLFREVESNDIDDAQSLQAEFLRDAKALEVKVAHKIYIEPLESIVDRMESDDYDDIVPLSFLALSAAVETAKSVVHSSPRDKDKIADAVEKGQIEIQHTENIAQEVKNLKSIRGRKYEAYLLNIEAYLDNINLALDGESMRRLSIASRAEKLAKYANTITLQSKNDQPAIRKLKNELDDTTKQNLILKEKISSLESKLDISEEER